MSFTILQNITAIGENLPTPFTATGGTAPYVYSVLAGGAGGSVNSSTGLYTSPTVLGTDTIQAVDNNSNVATATIKVLDPIGLFCDVIQTELGLADDQIYLYNQKFTIPNDGRLYINVSSLMVKPFGNSFSLHGTSMLLDTVQSTNFAETVSVDIFSTGNSARTEVGKLVMAFSSEYCLSQQEANGFRVFPISTRFHNLSIIEGIAIPYRYHLDVVLHYFLTRTVPVDYYDTFSQVAVTSDP